MSDSGLPDQLRTAALAWADQDPDPITREVATRWVSLAEAGDQHALAELHDAFSGPLTFGTAGLRAALGPGPNRMNRVVVSQAAAGLAAWLADHGHASGTVLVGFDARQNSSIFARDTAEILTGAGFTVLLTDQPTPTPVVAFGIGHLNCVAAVVVTASHNPATDNGYKVYLGDGSQIVPPTDAQIAATIAEAASRPLKDLARSNDYTVIGPDLVAAYVARCVELVPADAPRAVHWVYTAMHGVGARVVEQVVEATGFTRAIEVGPQIHPDPTFPTVPFPNPEEPGAIDMAVEMARVTGADLVIANDPDADRCAVATQIDGTWRMLTGDELGAILGDDALQRGVAGTFACSVVSSTLLGRMCAEAGHDFTTTLTGFKWIGRVPNLSYGYEEAIGYCCDPSRVPDKDGITALVSVLRITADLATRGKTLADKLDEIASRYGVHATAQLSARTPDLSQIDRAMATLRAAVPTTLLDLPVTARDLSVSAGDLPTTNAVELTGEFVHVVVRPSGTEPKLKCYLEVRVNPEESRANLAAARARAATQLDALRAEMANALGLS